MKSLHQLRKMVPKDVVIEIRSDGGFEFNNATVSEYWVPLQKISAMDIIK